MKYIFSFLLIVSALVSSAQDSIRPPKFNRHWLDFKDDFHSNRLYFYWGYNRSFFSHSDIHFSGPGYNFTIYDVLATDRPTKFSAAAYLNPAHITVPQY